MIIAAKWRKINALWHSCHWWQECRTRRITAMMTFAIVLLSLGALGVVTHFASPLRKGRTGYPVNLSVRRTPVRTRGATRVFSGALRTTKPPTGGRGLRRLAAIRR
jgi:hypothetical protein